MRIAYLDCFSGISGDMFMGALVDAGVPFSLLEKTVAGLNIGARIEISRVMRSGISAAKVDVFETQSSGHATHHSHHHEHQHSHHDKTEHKHGRGLREIVGIIEGATITESAKKTAIKIFEALGTAEAKIHNVDMQKIHFHEVGAVDAIVQPLGPRRWVSMKLCALP